MKSRLLAILVLAVAAGLLSQCTQQYTDGKTTMDDRTLRPGEAPIGASQKIPANDTRTHAASTDLTTWRIDPNAPKQSNGGSGSEVAPPLDQTAR
jgi:hypothetical protein